RVGELEPDPDLPLPLVHRDLGRDDLLLVLVQFPPLAVAEFQLGRLGQDAAGGGGVVILDLRHRPAPAGRGLDLAEQFDRALGFARLGVDDLRVVLGPGELTRGRRVVRHHETGKGDGQDRHGKGSHPHGFLLEGAGAGGQSGLTTSPPAGVTIAQNTVSATDGRTVRTLPSARATIIPARCGVCAISGSQSSGWATCCLNRSVSGGANHGRGATWNVAPGRLERVTPVAGSVTGWTSP